MSGQSNLLLVTDLKRHVEDVKSFVRHRTVWLLLWVALVMCSLLLLNQQVEFGFKEVLVVRVSGAIDLAEGKYKRLEPSLKSYETVDWNAIYSVLNEETFEKELEKTSYRKHLPKDGPEQGSSSNSMEELPHSPNGYICRTGYFGRLNNIIQETANGLFLAQLLNRSFLVGKGMSKLYNYEKWQQLFPEEDYKLPIGQQFASSNGDQHVSSQTAKDNLQLLKACKRSSATLDLDELQIGQTMSLKQAIDKYRNVKFLKISSEQLFEFNAVQSSHLSYKRAFFSIFEPVKRVRELALDFIAKEFSLNCRGSPSSCRPAPFIAVHLRNLEGTCEYRMQSSWLSTLLAQEKAGKERIGSDSQTNHLMQPFLHSEQKSHDKPTKSRKNEHFFELYEAYQQRALETPSKLAGTLEHYNFSINSLCSPPQDALWDIISRLFAAENRRLLKHLLVPSGTQNSLIMNVFLLSDSQLPQVDESYFQKQVFLLRDKEEDILVRFRVKRYHKKCVDSCPVIDFEIASLSNLFFGNYASSASRHIASMRAYRSIPQRLRQSTVYFPSILYYKEGIPLSHYFESQAWN